MKTEFNTDEDIQFLEQLLTKGFMSTEDNIFNWPTNELDRDWILYLIRFRRKCFEILEENDPHENYINVIEKKIYENNFEEVKKMDIDVPEYSY